MQNILDKVIDFHQAFKIPFNLQPTATPGDDIINLRHRLMAEENDEYLEACQSKDLSLIADALGDQLYILAGTMIAHGLQDKIIAVFDEIHKSNMSKLDENGLPIYREDGKVLKSNLYFKPNIQAILNQ
ncbi:MAG: hypothetical protein RIQ89_820 [Bacteroidota bacterium]|jgi:predicted HAD superfamily Cof-like phosphohydrolase